MVILKGGSVACDRLDGPLSLTVTSVKLWLVLRVLRRDGQPLCITFYANRRGRIIFPIRRLFGMQGAAEQPMPG